VAAETGQTVRIPRGVFKIIGDIVLPSNTKFRAPECGIQLLLVMNYFMQMQTEE
jgi:hypothetical protein